MWRISIKTEQNKEYLLSKFIKCLGCDLSRSFPWFTCMESAFTWNTPVDLKNGGQTLDFLPFSGSAYEPPVIFVSSLQLCWAEIFPYRLSIVLYFFINCNFISNIVTDKVGLDNACSTFRMSRFFCLALISLKFCDQCAFSPLCKGERKINCISGVTRL